MRCTRCGQTVDHLDEVVAVYASSRGTREAARRLGVSVPTLYKRLRAAGVQRSRVAEQLPLFPDIAPPATTVP